MRRSVPPLCCCRGCGTAGLSDSAAVLRFQALFCMNSGNRKFSEISQQSAFQKDLPLETIPLFWKQPLSPLDIQQLWTRWERLRLSRWAAHVTSLNALRSDHDLKLLCLLWKCLFTFKNAKSNPLFCQQNEVHSLIFDLPESPCGLTIYLKIQPRFLLCCLLPAQSIDD